MPIGTGIVYNTGDLILSQVSSSGTAFLETKIAAATSSLIYFDSTARINSASLNSITVGTASYVSGSTSIITNLTASNISASGTISASKLRVVGTANVIELVQATAGSATYYVMDNTVETGGRRYRFGYSGASADKGSFTIYNATDNITPFTILTDGNVGIGTLTPTTKLHVSGSITSTDGAFVSNVTSGTDRYFLNCYGTSTNWIFSIYENNNTAYLNSYSSMAFRANQNGGSGGYFVFTGANVGIGTTIPTATLHVADTTLYAPSLTWNSASAAIIRSENGQLAFGSDTTAPYPIWMQVRTISNTSRPMSLNPLGGNVGIGTTNPVTTLQVAGNVSGSSFTSSISNAVGFLGTSSWAQNVVSASYALTSSVATSETLATVTGRGASTSTQITVATAAGGSMYTGRKAGSSYGDGVSGATFKSITDNSQSFATSYAFAAYYSGSSGINSFYVSSNGDGYFSGSVGIGTTSPNSKLEVAGPAGTAVVSVTNSGNGRSGSFGIDGNGVFIRNSNDGDYFDLKNASGVARFRVIYDNATHLTTNFVSIGNLSATGSKLSVFGNLSVGSTYGSTAAPSNGAIFQGTVGVGTTSPDSAFHVYSTTWEPAIRITSTTGSVKTYGMIVSPYWATGSFHIYDYTTDNSRFQISTTGNVGIGVAATTPSNKLDLVGDLRVRSAGAAIILDTNASSDGRMEYKYNGTRKALIGVDSDNLQISADSGNYLQFRTNGSQRMIINNAGGVGIGTSNPNYAFDVYTNGSADALMSIRASGSANARIYFDAANGDLTGGDYCHLGQDKSTLNFVINTGGSAGNIHLQPKEGTNNGILFVSGSTRFGLVSTQNHQFTGSVSVSGSLNATASWATNALTASFLPVGTYNITSSWANNVVSSSFATTAQTANALNTANSYTITNLTASNISASLTGSFGIVGIGTNSPTQKLDVAGSAYAYNYFTLLTAATYGPSDNSAAMQVFGSTGSGGLTNTIKFVTGGSERWRITDTGILQSPAAQTIQTSTGNLTLATGGGNGHILLSPNGSGNVGIGSSSPSSKFEVLTSAVGLANQPNIIGNFRGDTDGRSLIRVDNTSTSAGAAALQAGISFVAYSNVSSQPSANKHEAQIILGSTGATSVTGGQTGTLQIVAPQDIAFNVSASNTIMTGSNYTAFGSNAMYITRLGSVGIGTTVPSARLHVTGSTGGIFEVDTAGGATTFYVSASGNVGIGTANATDKLTLYGALASYKTGADTIQTQVYLANTPNTRAFNVQLNSGGTGLDLWSYNSSNAWLRHTTFDYNGSVGIGTATSILGKLQLDSGVAPYYGPATGSATPNGMFTLGSVTGDVVNTFGVDASATAYAWIQPRKVTGATYYSLALNPNGGNVGIGTVTPTAKLEITGSSNSALLNIKSPISGAILYVSGSGAVGIGTSNVGAFTLQVSGSFGATTKSFIIDHPTKAGKKLMYGSLESPYHGIRLTGRDTLVNGKCKVELPDYMYKLILHDSINIQLTGIKCNKTLYVDDINIPENYFTIAYDKAIFESYKDYDFFWDFTAIRADVPELTTEL